MKNIAIIMAGGSGTRFWPASRKKLPKQFLRIGSDKSLINKTITRIEKLIPLENIFIVGSMNHVEVINDYLPKEFLAENILLEPKAKNTAAAVAASVIAITNRYGPVNIGVFPADHNIADSNDFSCTIANAYDQSEISSNIITLGVVPTFPSTGYGYLKTSSKVSPYIYKLDKFVEKPDTDLAMTFLEDGNYYWNSGIFFFKSDTILGLFKTLLPEIYHGCHKIDDWHKDLNSGRLNTLYDAIPSISIDYGIMEKTDAIEMIILKSGWSDLGSWDSLESILDQDVDGNIVIGKTLSLDTKNSVISSKDKLVVTIGLENIVIVETDDVLMVCDKSKVQDIKKAVSILNEKGLTSLI